jgi:hypothetical protein
MIPPNEEREQQQRQQEQEVIDDAPDVPDTGLQVFNEGVPDRRMTQVKTLQPAPAAEHRCLCDAPRA